MDACARSTLNSLTKYTEGISTLYLSLCCHQLQRYLHEVPRKRLHIQMWRLICRAANMSMPMKKQVGTRQRKREHGKQRNYADPHFRPPLAPRLATLRPGCNSNRRISDCQPHDRLSPYCGIIFRFGFFVTKTKSFVY